jgi:hypothetical protein
MSSWFGGGSGGGGVSQQEQAAMEMLQKKQVCSDQPCATVHAACAWLRVSVRESRTEQKTAL